MTSSRTLDVRALPGPEKHPTIFRWFGSLEPGESFVLVNSHDPVPLRHQFEERYPGEYGWTYQARGPSEWRVEISRVVPPGAAGHRKVAGEVMVFDLAAEQAAESDTPVLGRSGRVGRTLVKEGPLRVTLITLAPGGEIAEHRADGPLAVHPVSGRIRFTAGGESHDLRPGMLLTLAPHVPHAVRSEGGGSFLLLLARPSLPVLG